MAANLKPLEQSVLEHLNAWLPKLSNPVRIGEHDQTAFALGLILDYAHASHDDKLVGLVESKARQFYLADKNCPLAYEPSGEDFLSPCLGEADLMRRILRSRDFAVWLRTFLPQISASGSNKWLQPVVSPDRSDPKLAHLDGLNLSRAWMLEGIASSLPKGDKRLPSIRAAADAHRRAGLAAVTGEHYEGGHWLGSFAVYLVTRRGIRETTSTPGPQNVKRAFNAIVYRHHWCGDVSTVEPLLFGRRSLRRAKAIPWESGCSFIRNRYVAGRRRLARDAGDRAQILVDCTEVMVCHVVVHGPMAFFVQ